MDGYWSQLLACFIKVMAGKALSHVSTGNWMQRNTECWNCTFNHMLKSVSEYGV